MKKLLLLFMSCLSTAAMAQISATVTPTAGCPNSVSNVTVSVTNTTGATISGLTGITLNVKSNTATTLGTHNEAVTSFTAGETKTFVIVDVDFEGPMTCTIDGTVTGMTTMPSPVPPYMPIPTPFTINIPAQNYPVEYPTDLTITETSGDLSVSTTLSGLSVRYYLDGDYGTTVDESTTGNYTPTMDGSYTAKAYNTSNACLSENVSNAIVINTTTTEVKGANKINVSVYPNPITSSVTIETASASSLTYELSSSNGNVVGYGSFTGTSTIHMEKLNTGTYILTIKDGQNNLASYKLVK